MELFKISALTGKPHTMELPITEQEYGNLYHSWKESRALVQEAFPMLNAGQREFIMTGITPEEWDAFHGE